ncbi:Hypothetical protein SMAX5B_011966 [Scophthalmus maximus]|uniref:Uncharacterized protein n=1 Tax=Scophthalmus maximus TaxID=52904 RepID=A0A2U9AZ07_SCOMX|nr:Hypothetical protein SMAX5B_011966 [Scophthalmus maximus]
MNDHGYTGIKDPGPELWGGVTEELAGAAAVFAKLGTRGAVRLGSECGAGKRGGSWEDRSSEFEKLSERRTEGIGVRRDGQGKGAVSIEKDHSGRLKSKKRLLALS